MRPAIKKRVLVYFGVAILWMSYSCPVDAFVYPDRINTTKSLAHYSMGYIYDLLGVTNRAALEYEKAAQFDEASYLIHLRLGADYARLDMLQDAKEHLELVAQYNPQDLQSHYLLALIHSTEKDYDKAAEEYEHILKTFSTVEPQNIEIYGYLGQLYYSQKKYNQAIKQFEQILSFEQQNVDVMYLLGSLYTEINENDKAEDILRKGIAIDPEHEGCLNTLGYIYAEQNINLDEAIDLIERALKLNPYNGAYLDSLGWAYFKKKDYGNALKYLKEADAYMKDPLIYEHLGDVYFEVNQHDEALKNWERSLQMLPDQDYIKKKVNELKSMQAQNNL